MPRGWCQILFGGAHRRVMSSGHKLKHMRFHLNRRKNFFTLKAAEHWIRLPRESMESPSLETFQTWICAWVTCSRWPCLGRWVGLDDLQKSLLTIIILWFYDHFCWDKEFPVLFRKCFFPHCWDNSSLWKNSYSPSASLCFQILLQCRLLCIKFVLRTVLKYWQLHCTLVLGPDLTDNLN